MGQKRILIVSHYSLFDQGLRAALSRQPDVEIVGVCRDLAEAYDRSQTLKPDVLLLIVAPEIADGSAFRLLEEVSPVIIRISPTDGTMQVYRREQVDQASLSDLMTAIQATAIRLRVEEGEKPGPEQVESRIEDHAKRRRRDGMRHFVIAAVLVVIVTALVTIGLGNVQFLAPVASQEGAQVDQLFGLHIRVIAFLFSLIVVFTLYSVVVFRRKAGDAEDGRHIHGNTRLEIIWTVIPLITVLYFGVLGARQLRQITTPDPNELVVEVTAQQFAWRFDYPDYGITSAELNLPRGRQVLLKLASMDVIHDFWVPEFRVKQDAVPGMTTELRITPTQTGQYRVRCAELCGTAHYSMLAPVNVMEPVDFEAWLAEATTPAPAAASPSDAGAPAEEVSRAALGAELAQSQGCLGCHSVDGSQLVGPTWLGLYGTEELLEGGGSALVDEAYLRTSILEPGAQITRGYVNVMPATYRDTLSEEQIEALIEYIKSLGE
ncbi:MAG: hypothetical protein Kow0063_33490 [Anaerolineae bacterium]